MRKALGILSLLAVLVAAGAAVWLARNLDSIVEEAIQSYGSAMTKSRVEVGEVKIATGSGKATVNELSIGNPAGFKTRHALRVARIDVQIDVATLGKEAVTVNHIVIDRPDVIYEKGEATTNFDAIEKNISSYLGASKKHDNQHSVRLIVEELTICNATAQASAPFMGGKTVSIPLPDISLKNIGKAKGGVTPGELGQEIAGALKAKLSVSANFDRLRQSIGGAADKAGETVKGLFK